MPGGRPKTVAGGKPVVIACRFSEDEARFIDSQRKSLTRSQWLRWMVLQQKKGAS